MKYYENTTYFDYTMKKHLECTRHSKNTQLFENLQRGKKYDKHNHKNVKTKFGWLKKSKSTTKKWTAREKHVSDSVTYHRTKYSTV